MFSVIIPIYNAEKTIISTVNNILRALKSYEYELILINDGSTDNTLNSINSFKNNKNIKIINQENKGVSAARNIGIEKVSNNSKYITFIDDSDSISNNFFENNFKFLEKYKHVDLAAC